MTELKLTVSQIKRVFKIDTSTAINKLVIVIDEECKILYPPCK